MSCDTHSQTESYHIFFLLFYFIFFADLIFLALLSFVVMEATLGVYDVGWYEFVLWGWIACVLIEEFEQFRTSEGMLLTLLFIIL
jgi:hypothetical protein